jgi:hypothetical protein
MPVSMRDGTRCPLSYDARDDERRRLINVDVIPRACRATQRGM